jgi:hypothetical protein
MEYLKFCFDYWNVGGIANWIILSSTFFISIFLMSKKYSVGFTNIMIGVIPMLGLTGTVLGMIDTFQALQQTGADVQNLSAGISKAMITTATGLCVAIYGTCFLPLKQDHNFNPYEISYDNSPKESSTTDQPELELSKSRAETLKQSLDIEQQFYEEYRNVEILSTGSQKTDQSQKDHQLIEHARMIA